MLSLKKLSYWLIMVIFISAFATIILVPSAGSKKVIGSDIVSIYPIADSFVNETSPDTNYCGETLLKIKCDNYSGYAYILFDLSSIPSNAIIISADLWLTLTDIGGYGEWGVTIGAHYCPDNSWSETEITWNNKPAFNTKPTDTEGFWLVWLPSTDSWNITADVQTAFGLDKKLTEVIKFEEPKTVWGWAYFRSREASGVRLEIEYTTKPIYCVQFESIQDTGTTSNLGNIHFESMIFTLPNNALVVNGSYEAEYEGGYTFFRWETEGGIGVLDPFAPKTNVTVIGSGKLRAVGNAQTVQYMYDDSVKEYTTYQSAGDMVAVRFTPLFVGTLKKARFYIDRLYGDDTFNIHVMNANLSEIITPFSVTPTSTGWFEVDLSTYNINMREDFYIAMEWLTIHPDLGTDQSNPDKRSFDFNGTTWVIQSSKDYMIRAVVESASPIRPIGIISCIPLSDYIYGGQNVTVSGFITPPLAGVEVEVTYIRPDGRTVIRQALTNTTGGYTDTFMPDKLGQWKVMASWAGDEEYEGSKSYPEEFTVSRGWSSLYCYVDEWSITIGSSVNVSGSLTPPRVVSVKLEHSTDGGATWTIFATVNTTSQGEFFYIWTPKTLGTHNVRASWPGDEVCEGDTSWESSLSVLETEETFWVYVEQQSFGVTVKCNSTLTNLSFNQTEKMIGFQLIGISETVGYCTVSFPDELLGGPYTILINDLPPTTSKETLNGDMSINFTFNFNGPCTVKIIGKTVIPEFSNIVLPLFMVVITLFTIILQKIKRNIKRSS
jgi:hypothetical protein